MHFGLDSVLDSLSRSYQWQKIRVALAHLAFIIGMPLIPFVLFVSWLPVVAGVLAVVGLILSVFYVAPRMSFILAHLNLGDAGNPAGSTYEAAKSAFAPVKWAAIFTSSLLGLAVGVTVAVVMLVAVLLGLIPVLGVILNGVLFLPLVAVFFCIIVVSLFSSQLIMPLLAKYQGGIFATSKRLVVLAVGRIYKLILFNTMASLIVTPLLLTIVLIGIGAIIAALIPGVASVMGGVGGLSNPLAALGQLTNGIQGFFFLLFYGLGAGAILTALFALVCSVTSSVGVGVFLATEDGFTYEMKVDPKNLSDALKK